MQLHDFTDLQSFPSRLRSLTLCLSENIFLEGFLRKVYTFISSVEMLHIVGTYEKVEDEEEEVYETVNVFKLKQFLPNLRVVNLWGVPFITDEHVDAISSNCAHLECLCVNYCTKVTGSCLKLVLQRCKKLKSLFLAHTSIYIYDKTFKMLYFVNFPISRVIVMGIAEDCCPKVVAKIHVDQFIDCIAQNCPRLMRLEIRWDDDTLRFSDKSSQMNSLLILGVLASVSLAVVVPPSRNNVVECLMCEMAVKIAAPSAGQDTEEIEKIIVLFVYKYFKNC
uniref:F-box domain-containing protein n=1 Tax=Heterorhabditis bacteriophora TaxID=37862 RepID=A0A1I7XQV9_HETBA